MNVIELLPALELARQKALILYEKLDSTEDRDYILESRDYILEEVERAEKRAEWRLKNAEENKLEVKDLGFLL